MVLLIGGASGTGKSVAAERLGQRLGLPWLQVDDLRIAIQFGGIVTPEAHPGLFHFLATPDVWRQPPEALRDRLIAIGDAMSPAIEIVIEHHIVTGKPLIIEGDGILPALFTRPAIRDYLATGQVRAVFLREADEEAIAANMRDRARGFDTHPAEAQRTQVRMNHLYSAWLCAEAGSRGLPVLASRPWSTLSARILDATDTGRTLRCAQDDNGEASS
jgi:2-phosphoglycerate kinase